MLPLLLLAPLSAAASSLPSPDGDWFTENKDGVVTIAPCGSATCGEISGVDGFQSDGSAPRDSHGASECHLRIIRDMVPGDDGRFHGTITDPRDGSVYQAQLWLGEDGTLNLHGYLAVPLLGTTQRWLRFTGSRQPDCHFSLH